MKLQLPPIDGETVAIAIVLMEARIGELEEIIEKHPGSTDSSREWLSNVRAGHAELKAAYDAAPSVES